MTGCKTWFEFLSLMLAMFGFEIGIFEKPLVNQVALCIAVNVFFDVEGTDSTRSNATVIGYVWHCYDQHVKRLVVSFGMQKQSLLTIQKTFKS